MEGQAQDVLALIALSMGAAWASGINLYATVLALGLGSAMGYVALPEALSILSDPLVIAAAGFMYLVEFFADKVPGVDTGWDTLHTFIRIPAGALLAAGTVADVGPAAELAALLVGGTMAGVAHLTKASTRVVINTSPEPVSNWAASITEDLMVLGGLWTALNHPWLFVALLVLFIALAAWLLPRLWRTGRRILRRVFRRGGQRASPPVGTGVGGAADVAGAEASAPPGGAAVRASGSVEGGREGTPEPVPPPPAPPPSAHG